MQEIPGSRQPPVEAPTFLSKYRMFVQRHPFGYSIFILVVFTLPQWFQAVFAIFTTEALVPWLLKRGITIPDLPIISWITSLIGVFLIWRIYRETKKPRKINVTIGNIAWEAPHEAPVLPPVENVPGAVQLKSLTRLQAVLVVIATICAVSPLFKSFIPQQSFYASVLFATPVVNQAQIITNSAEIPNNTVGAAVDVTMLDTNGANFELILRVVNIGKSASVLWDWKVLAILPNGQRIPAQIPYVISVQGTPLATPFGPFRCTVENNLVQALVTRELPVGSAAVGWITFHVNGITKVPLGTRFVITFEDVFGRETVIQHLWDNPIGSTVTYAP
jgi:hypothetical protein